MERKIPKNVRQIGNVSDTLKIYVEDYVDTYLNQLCEKESDGPAGAILIGEQVKKEEEEYVFISGAVKMQNLLREADGIEVTEEIWKECVDVGKAFFPNGQIVGWCGIVPGIPFSINEQLKKTHAHYFSKEQGIFILKDPVTRDELYFSTKFNDLMPMNGHYVYYEKNPEMQNYMISSRKKIGVTPSEVVADRAAKNFRNLVETKMVMQEKYKINKFVRGAGAALALVLLIAIASFLNNYDRAKAVQMAMETMADTVQAKEIRKKEEGEKETEEKKEVKLVESEPDHSEGEQIENEVEEEENTYVVQAGDTLAGISKKAYGDIFHIKMISEKNHLENGNLIYVGQKLILP